MDWTSLSFEEISLALTTAKIVEQVLQINAHLKTKGDDIRAACGQIALQEA